MAAHFRAPWGTKLKVITFGLLALFAAVAVATGPPVTWILLAIVFAAATFMVRGYSVIDGKLLVHRFGWATSFDLAELRAAEFSPGATMGSIRLLGNGGLFGFVGRFRNAVLGPYRAYATDDANTVVLEFPDLKLVVTPEEPAAFLAALESEGADPAATRATGEPA